MVNNNSVGICYWQCKMKALKNSIVCENTTGIQFGLQVSLEFLLALVAKDIIRGEINFLNSLILFHFMKC